ncbi:hypothetical protein AVEN_144323-1 [Araneus ventricosus]|uniref:DUF4371 domain-containing protein n=1 Tax=Araneus ventricosus TaxID=182803 RepID=A0A4Y2J9L1_ARAVE|nr:hypothetical protein AVEN_144323-1 [Araneus ventricosus]
MDKNKIRREIQNVRAELCRKSDEFPLQGVYLDGRKDDTLVVDLAHSKSRVKKSKSSLIQEPGSVYIGHVTLTSGSSEDIVTSIISYLSGRGISIKKLVVIRCNGTADNTGWKNGLIRRIEIHLWKSLQWVVCLLYFNELPFRYLFQYLDGKSLRGSIGEKLSGCGKHPVIGFKSTDCQIPTIDRSILRKDQQYLLYISMEIKSGNCKEDLAVRDPGPLSQQQQIEPSDCT